MRTDPFTDSWLFLIGQHGDQISLGAWRWLVVALFVALLAGSVAIAVRRWSEEPEQRTGNHAVVWFLRILIGSMWFQGMLWKLPFFTTANGLYHWTKEMVTNAAFPFYGEIVGRVLLPNFNLFDPLVFFAELVFATSLILGLGVRLTGALGVLFVLNLWIGLYRHPQEWPWTYIFLAGLLGLFSVQAAGRSLGLDGWLRNRYPPAMTNGWIAAFARYFA